MTEMTIKRTKSGYAVSGGEPYYLKETRTKREAAEWIRRATATQTLAERAAWFHAPHTTAKLNERAHDDRGAWLAYVQWHKTATDPDNVTPQQCRKQIGTCQAGRLDHPECDQAPAYYVKCGRRTRFDQVGEWRLCESHALDYRGLPAWRVIPLS